MFCGVSQVHPYLIIAYQFIIGCHSTSLMLKTGVLPIFIVLISCTWSQLSLISRKLASFDRNLARVSARFQHTTSTSTLIVGIGGILRQIVIVVGAYFIDNALINLLGKFARLSLTRWKRLAMVVIWVHFTCLFGVLAPTFSIFHGEFWVYSKLISIIGTLIEFRRKLNFNSKIIMIFPLKQGLLLLEDKKYFCRYEYCCFWYTDI